MMGGGGMMTGGGGVSGGEVGNVGVGSMTGGGGKAGGRGMERALTPTGEVHSGRIKSFSEVTNYGFIACPAVKEKYGCDVFFNGEVIQGMKIGQKVCVSIGLNKDGKPNAIEVMPEATLAAPKKNRGSSAAGSKAGEVGGPVNEKTAGKGIGNPSRVAHAGYNMQ